MNDDGHSSACTWTKCAHPESPNPCPFEKPAESTSVPGMIDEAFAKSGVDLRPVNHCISSPHGRHEWRERADYRDTYYCVFCLQYNKNGIVT